MFDRTQPATKANLLAAERFLELLETRSGAQIVGAIDNALRPAIDAGERRFVVFLTDGAVAHDTELVAAAADLVARARAVGGRAHVFAVSPNVNHDDALLRELAEAGDTELLLVGVWPDVRPPIVDSLFRYVDPPALAELTVDWPGVVVDEVYPSEVPDLDVGGELLVVGRYRGTPTSEPSVRGRILGEAEPVELAVTLQPRVVERLVSTPTPSRWRSSCSRDPSATRASDASRPCFTR